MALALGVEDVDEMAAGMPLAAFGRWVAYLDSEGVGPEHDDLRFALTLQSILAPHVQNVPAISDLMPPWRQERDPPPSPSRGRLASKMNMFLSQHGASP